MPSTRHRWLAVLLGLMGLVMSLFAPLSASGGESGDGTVPGCCLRVASRRCCSGDCCVAKRPESGVPGSAIPSLPGPSVRITPAWVPAFLEFLASDSARPAAMSRPARVFHQARATRVPLFLRDAALLI